MAVPVVCEGQYKGMSMRNTRKSIWKDKVFLSLMGVCLLAVLLVSTNMVGKSGAERKERSEEETTSMEELAADNSLQAIEGENGKILVDRDADETEEGVKAAASVPKEYKQEKETGKNAVADAEKKNLTDKTTVWDRREQTETAKAETEPVTEPQSVEPSVEDASTQVNQSILQFDGSTRFAWPVEGELLMQFAMDHTVYHPTLQQYKVSPAVIIQAEVGTTVTTPAVGLVEELGWNEEIGNYLRINLGNDYQVILGQLENMTVQAGQYVAPGNQLATVAAPTKYYAVEGPNVYFELKKNGVAADPTEYLE